MLTLIILGLLGMAAGSAGYRAAKFNRLGKGFDALYWLAVCAFMTTLTGFYLLGLGVALWGS